MPRHFRLFLGILGLIFLVSCTSSHSSNDSDILPDSDSDSDGLEAVDDDLDFQDSDFIDDFDEILDDDTDSKDDSDVFEGDWQQDIDIPERSDDPYFETYGEADYNVAYYYYGDAPTSAKDPENVKILWSKNCIYECVPEPYDFCAENYPFEPQIVYEKGNKEKSRDIGKFQCDALLTPGPWQAAYGVSLPFNQFEGKFVYNLDVPAGNTDWNAWETAGMYVYDLNTRKVERLGREHLEGWQNKRYYFIETMDYRVNSLTPEDSPCYGKSYSYLIYYDKETNTYGRAFKMSETPEYISDIRATETYLFANFQFTKDEKIMYTKMGEWDEWKELLYQKETLHGGNRRAGYPSMIGSYVTYFDYNTPIQVQFCDLAVGDSSCFRVSREGENGRYPFFKDKNTIIYAAENLQTSLDSFVVADISDPKNIKYSTLYEGFDMLGAGGVDINDNYFLLHRRYSDPRDSSKEINDQCLYRFADKKLVCFDEEFDLAIEKDESFIYKHTYIFFSDPDLVVRDLECYCDFYPNKCPLIDYTPNPDNPKKPWGFEWKPENLRNINKRKNLKSLQKVPIPFESNCQNAESLKFGDYQIKFDGVWDYRLRTRELSPLY